MSSTTQLRMRARFRQVPDRGRVEQTHPTKVMFNEYNHFISISISIFPLSFLDLRSDLLEIPWIIEMPTWRIKTP